MAKPCHSLMTIKVVPLLSLAFILQIMAIFLLGRHKNPELWEYNEIALNILHGKGYVINLFNTDYRSFGFPGHPLFLTLSHVLLKSDYFLFALVQVILSLAAFYLIYLTAKKIFGEGPALVSLFLLAIHPGLVVYSTKIHELNLVIFLIALIVWFMSSLDCSKIGDNVFLGILIGIGVLTRPTLIFFVPVYFLYLWWRSVKMRNIIKAFLIVLVSALFVILPWTLRNYHIHKRWIFITTTSAESFWRGNNQFSSGTALTPDNRSIIDVAPKEFLAKLYKMNEIEQHDLFYRETIDFIKLHPAFFIKMIFKKMFYFWWFSPQTGLWYPLVWTVLYKAYYTVIFSLFALGAVLGVIKKTGYQRALILTAFALFAFVSFSNSLYYVDTRHRWAIEPLMLIFSAYGATELCEVLKRRRKDVTQRDV